MSLHTTQATATVLCFASLGRKMKKTLAGVVVAVLSCTLTACTTVSKATGPVAAEPFPLQWKLVTTASQPVLQLCWIEKEQIVGCLDRPSTIKTKESATTFSMHFSALQLLLCADFRAELANQPKKALWVGIVSELLSAASPVVSDETRSRTIAAGGSFTSITASEIDSHLDAEKIEIALLGIELARTNIFKSVIKSAGKDLPEYPVNRAINDALRYPRRLQSSGWTERVC